jgi:hypothetical protein
MCRVSKKQVITIRAAPNRLNHLPCGEHTNLFVNLPRASAIFRIYIHSDQESFCLRLIDPLVDQGAAGRDHKQDYKPDHEYCMDFFHLSSIRYRKIICSLPILNKVIFDSLELSVR